MRTLRGRAARPSQAIQQLSQNETSQLSQWNSLTSNKLTIRCQATDINQIFSTVSTASDWHVACCWVTVGV
jgi:hypothetical protein